MPTPAPWQSRIVGHRDVAPDDLVANPRNWRGHPPQQSQALGDVLAEVGWVQSVIRNVRTGRLIDGHLRVDMAKARGEATVPVVDVDLSEDEEALILATIDPIGALAEANADRLADLMEGLEIQSEAVRAMLEDVAKSAQRDLTEGLTDPDSVPEVGTKPITEPGDIWILGEHRILCGDATQREDVGYVLGGARPELLFTDPPYGVMHGRGVTKARQIGGDLSQAVIPLSFAVAIEVLADDARLYVCGGSENLSMYLGLWDHYLGRQPRIIIWVKESFVLRQHGYHSQYELIFHGWKGNGGAVWFGDRKQSDVWQVHRQRDTEHSTEKPVELASRAIRDACSVTGDVYEPFLGSGSTLIAAEQLNRRCFGIEISPIYVDVVVKRWENFTGQKAELVQHATS